MPVRDTSSRPARRTGYTFANQGAAASASTGAGVGKHVLRRIPGVDLWSPSWGEETVIRIFPATNPDNRKEFDPYRLSADYCNFGDWIRVYEAVRNFGNPGVTMLLHDGLNQSYDAQLMNPCWILHRAINQACAQGQGLPEWFPLTKGSQGKGAALAKPSKLYLVQCAIFRHKSKDTFGPGKPPLGASPDGPTIVMGLPPTAGETLVQLLEEKAEDWKGDPGDVAQYKYGDVVGLKEGAFVHIYELGKDPRQRFNTARQGTNAASIYQAAPGTKVGFGGQSMEPKGYGVFITKTLDDGPNDVPASLEGLDDLVRSKFKPWETILEFKSDEEQAHLVAPLFPASAILYAWRDHPSWIPDNVREAGNYEARRPVSAPVVPSAGTQVSPWSRTKPASPVPTTRIPVKEEQEMALPDEIPDTANADYSIPEAESLDAPVDDTKVQSAKAKLAAANRRLQERSKSEA